MCNGLLMYLKIDIISSIQIQKANFNEIARIQKCLPWNICNKISFEVITTFTYRNAVWASTSQCYVTSCLFNWIKVYHILYADLNHCKQLWKSVFFNTYFEEIRLHWPLWIEIWKLCLVIKCLSEYICLTSNIEAAFVKRKNEERTTEMIGG